MALLETALESVKRDARGSGGSKCTLKHRHAGMNEEEGQREKCRRRMKRNAGENLSEAAASFSYTGKREP